MAKTSTSKKLISRHNALLAKKREMTKNKKWEPVDGAGILPEKVWRKLSPKTKITTALK